jgi:hypothetical protein
MQCISSITLRSSIKWEHCMTEQRNSGYLYISSRPDVSWIHWSSSQLLSIAHSPHPIITCSLISSLTLEYIYTSIKHSQPSGTFAGPQTMRSKDHHEILSVLAHSVLGAMATCTSCINLVYNTDHYSNNSLFQFINGI